MLFIALYICITWYLVYTRTLFSIITYCSLAFAFVILYVLFLQVLNCRHSLAHLYIPPPLLWTQHGLQLSKLKPIPGIITNIYNIRTCFSGPQPAAAVATIREGQTSSNSHFSKVATTTKLMELLYASPFWIPFQCQILLLQGLLRLQRAKCVMTG